MAYNKTNWQSLPSTDTPISVGNLNKIENGIYDNSVAIETANTNISNINTNINNITGQILWTNSNPTSSFSAQDITLSSDDYDILEIFYNQGITNTKNWSVKMIKGYGSVLQTIIDINAGVSQSTGFRSRMIDYVSDTKLHAYDCLIRSGSATSVPETTNTALIPLYIIGYKTGLFDNV